MAIDLFASNEGLDASQPVAGADLFADPNAPGPFARGVKSGVAGVKGALYGAGALAARGATAILPDAAAPFTQGLEAAALENVAAQNEIAGEGAMGYQDVLEDPTRSAEYFKYLLGQAVPSLAVMAAGGGLGALAGRAVAGQAGMAAARAAGVVAPAVRTGALAGAVTPDVAMEAGSIYPEALETGVENPGLRALAGGAAAGAIDFIPLLAAEKYLKPIGKGGFGAMARGAVKGAPVGAALEGSQELSQTLVERLAAGKSLTGPDAVSEYIESFLGGAAPGSVFGAAIGARRQAKAVTIDNETGQPVQETPPSTEREQGQDVNVPAPLPGMIDPNLSTTVPDLSTDPLQAELLAKHGGDIIPADLAAQLAQDTAIDQGLSESPGAIDQGLSESPEGDNVSEASVPAPLPGMAAVTKADPVITPKAAPIVSDTIQDPNAVVSDEVQIDRAVKGVHAMFRERGMPLTTTRESLATPSGNPTPRELAIERQGGRGAVKTDTTAQMAAVEDHAMAVIEPLAMTLAKTKTDTPGGQAKIAKAMTASMREVVQEAAKQPSVEAAQQYVTDKLPGALKGHGVQVDAADMAKAVSAAVGQAKTQFSKGAIQEAQANSLAVVKKLRGAGLDKDAILVHPEYQQAKAQEAAIVQQDAQETAAAETARTSLDGFENTFTPPQRAKAIAALTGEQHSVNGAFQTRRDFVRSAIADGAKVGDAEGGRALVWPDGRYMRQKDITKTALDYAEFLQKNPQQSNAALTQDEFDTLPEPAKFAAVDEFNRIMRAKGVKLRERLLQLVGNDPRLVVKTFMATPDSPIGSYTRVDKLKSVIALALNAKDELSVADHEGYHYAEDRLMDARERRIVANAMKPGRPLFESLMAKVRAYDIANGTNLADEVSAVPAEARAYAFEFWRRGELQAEGPVARAWQKLKQFLERVANLVRGDGFTSIEDVFRALDLGQFAERYRGDVAESGLPMMLQQQAFSKSADYTQTPEFKKWFGDSKVVDAEGKPLVVYHGTHTDFSEFNRHYATTKFGRAPQRVDTIGLWFTTSAERGYGPITMPTYLSIKKPLIFTGSELNPQQASKQLWKLVEDAGGADKFRDQAIAEGYDGVAIKGDLLDHLPGDVYVAFHPTQIKSAIGNTGAFDPTNPDIRFSQAAVATQSALAEMTTRFQNGELERTQLQQAWATLNDNAQIPDATFKFATGLAKAEVGGLRDWWFKHIATPNYVSRFSAGYKNVMNTLNTYIRYRKILAEQMLREKLPSWYKASDVDRKAAFGVMLKRTVEGYSKSSTELTSLLESLTTEQHKLYDQATTMIEGFLRAQFAKDQISRRSQLTSEGAYEKWEAERRAQVDSMIDKGYVPLRRYGDYSVRVYSELPDGKKVDIGLVFVDTARGQHTVATMYQEEIKRSGANLKVEIGTRDKNQRETGVSIEQFLGTLRRNGVEISQAERERLVLTMTNSESMIRNKMMHREGLSGYSEDSMRVLHEFGVNMSGELAYARFADALDAAMEGRAVTADVNSRNSEPEIKIDEPRKNEAGEWAETADEYKARSLWRGGDPMAGFYKGLSTELSNYVLVPDHSGGWSRRLRAAAMVYFIGGSISAGVVNAMSVPMLVVPELSVHTGYGNSLATTMGAWKDAWRYYHILHDMEKLKSDDPRYAIPGFDTNLRQAIAAAADHIFDTEIHQMLGMSQGTVYSKSRNVQRAMEAWMLPFRVSEQANRLASFIAAYRVATTGEGVKGRGKLHGQELFKFASGIVDATQNNYNESNRPGAARHPVFAMMFMFKSFPLFMIEAISLMYKQNPRSAVYMLLGLTMMTGVQGLPFAETLLDLIDTISQRIFNSPFNARRAMRNVIKAGSEAMVGADLSDVVLRGVLNDVLGVSMASRIGTGDFVPGTRLGAADADSGRVLAEMLGAPFAMVKDAAASVGKFTGGVFTGDWKEAADAIRAGGPIAMRNLVKGAEQLESGFAKDARGRKIVDVNTLDGLFQLVGLSSAKVAKMYDMETINIQTKAFYNQFSQDLQGRFVQAVRDGDVEKMQEITDLRAAWNAENPTMPIMPNAASVRRAIILSGVPLDQRSRMLWGRRLGGANIFTEEAGQ